MRIANDFLVLGDLRPQRYLNQDIRHDVIRFSDEIESMFGPATNEWELKGIVFKDEDSSPCIFFPKDTPGAVMIHLTANAVHNIEYAKFQLAHEIVHCLSPSGTSSTNVFEEGMAAWYQQRLATLELDNRVQLGDKRYAAARILFNRMQKKCKDAVKSLRLIEPNMWKINKATFIRANVCLNAGLISLLTMPFSEFDPFPVLKKEDKG